MSDQRKCKVRVDIAGLDNDGRLWRIWLVMDVIGKYRQIK